MGLNYDPELFESLKYCGQFIKDRLSRFAILLIYPIHFVCSLYTDQIL